MLIFGGGIFTGWLSLAGLTWLLIWWDDRKREKEDC
jgi:hypothetical protein